MLLDIALNPSVHRFQFDRRLFSSVEVSNSVLISYSAVSILRVPGCRGTPQAGGRPGQDERGGVPGVDVPTPAYAECTSTRFALE